MPIIKSDFKPAWWLRGAHQQTVWSTLFREIPDFDLTKERIELDDGDFLDLAWSGSDDGEIVLILHGLEGNKDSPYAKGIMQTLSVAGYQCCLMHFRGCSGETNRLPRSYHSGDTGDLQQVVDHIQKHHQRKIFSAVGYSLGGNALLKWMGEKGNDAEMTTAIGISVPFTLHHAAERMAKGLSHSYEKHLVSRLQEKYRHKFSGMSSPLDIEIDQMKTFFLFDDQVTAPLHGFKGVNDYYKKSSCAQFLLHITKPTLILHAKDDPFMWPDSVPAESELSPAVRLELSEKGGHVGFISSSCPWRSEYWLDQRILAWLNSQKESVN